MYELGVDLEVEGMRYIEMHRGPAAYVLGPPPSRSRDLELEGGVIACHVDYVYEPQDFNVFRSCSSTFFKEQRSRTRVIACHVDYVYEPQVYLAVEHDGGV